MADLTDRFSIVGGGYTGLILALYLAERGFRNIEVFDGGDELATLQKAHMFTVRRADGMHNLADILDTLLDNLYVDGIEFKRWTGLKEDAPDFIFQAALSNEQYACGLINPDSMGPALLNALKRRGVDIKYKTKVVAEGSQNGQKLLAISDDGVQEIRTDYLFDATNFGVLFRSLRDKSGKPLLDDDPRICDLMCIRTDGTMRTDAFVSIFGPNFGPFSWVAPSSPDARNPGYSTTIDFIATRYCHLSERDEQILAQRLKNMLNNSSSNSIFQRESVRVNNLAELVQLSNDELASRTNMKGIYRMEPSDDIALDSVPDIARKGVFLVGNSAGWGQPTTANIFYVSIQIIEQLAYMLKDNKEHNFFNWWRYKGPIDYDFSMAFKQSRIAPDNNRRGRIKFINALNSLPDDAKFAAAIGARISLPNKLRLMKGNLQYLAGLMAKAHLPFRLGYVIDGGYCYGKKWGEPLQPLTFSFAAGLSRQTRHYGY